MTTLLPSDPNTPQTPNMPSYTPPVSTISSGFVNPTPPKPKVTKTLILDLFMLFVGIIAISGFGYAVFTRVIATGVGAQFVNDSVSRTQEFVGSFMAAKQSSESTSSKKAASGDGMVDAQIVSPVNVAAIGSVSVSGKLQANTFGTTTVAVGSVAGKATSGKLIIKAGLKSIRVTFDRSVLTAESLVLVTPDMPIAVGAKKISDSMIEITLADVQKDDVMVVWWVLN